MSMTHAIGVDPGLVHTGVVSLVFRPAAQMIDVEHTLINGPDAASVAAWVRGRKNVYIEQYRVRQHFSTDTRMLAVEQDLRAAIPSAKFLANTGIKRVVLQPMMELLEVWAWSRSSHHQDLRSAARIALLGMLKDEVTNQLLADVVRAHLDGSPWTVTHV